MKVLIAGNPERGKQWEKYLRKRQTVKEVVVTPRYHDETTDAVILLDDSPDNLNKVLHIMHRGIPAYLVSKLPAEIQTLQKIQHASEEAGVCVQFSHWASFSSMTRWVKQKLGTGSRFIDIQKQDRGRSIPKSDHFRHGWMDELAFILSLQKRSVQNITVQPIQLQKKLIGVHILLRFDNSDLAALMYMGVAAAHRHERMIQNESSMFVCDIISQKGSRYSTSNDNKLLNADHQSFDASVTAENSLDSFFRSIKSHKPSGFSASQALQTARLANQVDDILARA